VVEALEESTAFTTVWLSAKRKGCIASDVVPIALLASSSFPLGWFLLFSILNKVHKATPICISLDIYP
jgi:hypothetical protein